MGRKDKKEKFTYIIIHEYSNNPKKYSFTIRKKWKKTSMETNQRFVYNPYFRGNAPADTSR